MEYKERKKIVIDSCNTCPFNGACEAWGALTKRQKVSLAIGLSTPEKFILHGCPLPYGPDGEDPTMDESGKIIKHGV